MSLTEPYLAKLDIEFIIIGLISGMILCVTVILPYISVGYDLDRIYLLVSVFLSTFFVIGGIHGTTQLTFFFEKVFDLKRSILSKVLSPTCIISYLVILNFLFSMGVPHQFAGDTVSFLFHTNPEAYKIMIFYDKDSAGAQWIQEFRDKGLTVYSDVYSEKVLQSQAHIRSRGEIPLVNSTFFFKNGYLFTITDVNLYNRIYNKWRDNTNFGPRYKEMVRDLNKIFSNKGSVIWMTT